MDEERVSELLQAIANSLLALADDRIAIASIMRNDAFTGMLAPTAEALEALTIQFIRPVGRA